MLCNPPLQICLWSSFETQFSWIKFSQRGREVHFLMTSLILIILIIIITNIVSNLVSYQICSNVHPSELFVCFILLMASKWEERAKQSKLRLQQHHHDISFPSPAPSSYDQHEDYHNTNIIWTKVVNKINIKCHTKQINSSQLVFAKPLGK